MTTAYSEHKTELAGHVINFVRKGKGQPVIFLHNGGGFWQSWIHQVDYFSQHFEVFAIDWPGFGESSALKEPLSLQLLTRVLDEFIEQEKLDRVTIIGNCIGGSTGLNYAIGKPGKVEQLILFNICPGSGIYRNRPAAWMIKKLNRFPRIKKGISRILKFVFTKTPVKKKFPAILFSRKIKQDDFLFAKYVQKIKEEQQTTSRINMVFAVHTFTIDALLDGRKPFKNVLLWGSDNRVTPLKSHGFLHRGKVHPDRFEIIPGGSHLCMYEQPELINSMLEELLQKKRHPTSPSLLRTREAGAAAGN